MKEKFTINASCIYCGSKKFDKESQDEITICCAKCGKRNSLITLKEQAIQKGQEQVIQKFQQEINKMCKDVTIKLKL